MTQASLDVERFVRDDLATAHALGVDQAALTGTGADNQPQGLIGTGNVGSVVMGDPDGAVPTYAKGIAFETAVSALNGDVADAAFLTTPGIRAKLKLTQRFTNSDLAVWGAGQVPGEGELAGYRAVASNQVPSTLSKGGSSGILHAILFGYWPSLVIGEWGILEILTDPYAKKRRGMVEVTSYGMVDVACRQPAQFAVCLDAKVA